MPPKKARDLTTDEFKLLVIAAKMLAASQKWAERPLSPNEQATWDIRASEELMAVGVIYKKYAVESKNPRCHPIVQHLANEWKRAAGGNDAPDWNVMSVSSVQRSCMVIAARHGDWHPDLTASDLSGYLTGMSAAKQWWDQAAPEPEEDVPMGDPTPPPPQPPSPQLPPSPSGPQTRNKGKARMVSQKTPAAPKAAPTRGTKRPSPANRPVELADDDGETTPRKGGGPSGPNIPRVQIDDASPPPAQRARIEPEGMVATGEDMCGPCKNAERAECRSQVRTGRITTACEFCKAKKKTCTDPASWARPIHAFMNSQGQGSPGAPMGIRALSERLDSVIEHTDNRLDIIEYNQRKEILLLNALCAKQGIDMSTIPGIDELPPIRRSLSPRSASPSPSLPPSITTVSSSSSTGMGLSSLTLSDTHSSMSAHSTIASGRQGREGNAIAGSSRHSSGTRK